MQFSQSVDLNYVESCATHLSGDPTPWVSRDYDKDSYTRRACLKMEHTQEGGVWREDILPQTEDSKVDRYLEVQVKHIDKGKCIYIDESIIDTKSQCMRYRLLRESRDFVSGFDQLEYGFGLQEMESFTDQVTKDMNCASAVLDKEPIR